jgi:hypothetical protein
VNKSKTSCCPGWTLRLTRLPDATLPTRDVLQKAVIDQNPIGQGHSRISAFLGFFLRPEHRRSGVDGGVKKADISLGTIEG